MICTNDIHLSTCVSCGLHVHVHLLVLTHDPNTHVIPVTCYLAYERGSCLAYAFISTHNFKLRVGSSGISAGTYVWAFSDHTSYPSMGIFCCFFICFIQQVSLRDVVNPRTEGPADMFPQYLIRAVHKLVSDLFFVCFTRWTLVTCSLLAEKLEVLQAEIFGRGSFSSRLRLLPSLWPPPGICPGLASVPFYHCLRGSITKYCPLYNCKYVWLRYLYF